jgi:fructose-specific PTS system IIA-like component
MTQKTNSSLQFVFVCPLASGLHARPASHLAEVANRFAAEGTLTNLRNGLVGNCKSVLGIIATDTRHGDRCAVQVEGPDERAAYEALLRFAQESLPQCDVPLDDAPEAASVNTLPRVLQAAKVNCIFGVPVSRGIGQGKVVIVRQMALPNNISGAVASDPDQELEQIRNAVAVVRRRIGEKLKHSPTATGAAVLRADLAMAGDVFLVEKVTEQVLLGRSAGQAVVETGKYFIDLLEHSENEYIRQRAADIEEICLQLLEEIPGGNPASTAVDLHEPSVLVAETVAPQQLLELDRQWVKALVLEYSATTSHAAILARSLGIPTLAGVKNARSVFAPGRDVVVDANRGFIVPEFSPAVRRFYDREQKTLAERRETRLQRADKRTLAADGRSMEVGANVSSAEEAKLAFEGGADGLGLFRTEMLFLGREEAPSEREQAAIYSEAARAGSGRPVIIRTLDIGGDKNVPYLNFPREDNPFLGYRGVRIYAQHSELLQTQLRAVLRASAVGRVQIMAPMISSLSEIVEFKAAVARAMEYLGQHGVAYDPGIPIGIMVEVPSIAFMLDSLCAEVDFFSIGTNDLSQYFFAADRGNPRLTSLFSVRDPAFLRFLRQIVQQVHQAGKWIGMCGEMAADPKNLPLLLGLGLDEISVPAAEVDDFQQALVTLPTGDCLRLFESAIACGTTAEVDNLQMAKEAPHRQSLLSDALVLLGSSSQTKEEVIQEMIDALYVSHRTDDRRLLEEALWARESVYSTGLGYGFATPHCKTDAVTADSICVLRLNQPINWDSVDGEQVRMVVLLSLRDSEAANTHMQVFSSLARKLMNEDFRHQLLKLETPHQTTTYLAEELGIPFVQ